jgi:hypothetical protein
VGVVTISPPYFAKYSTKLTLISALDHFSKIFAMYARSTMEKMTREFQFTD